MLACATAHLSARYDFNESIAVQAQLGHTVREDQPDLNGLPLQVAFAF
jgi:hypothetical protein